VSRALVVLVVVLGVAALCAGLWVGRSGGAKGPSRAAYLAQVSAVCRAYARRLERVPVPSEPQAYGDVLESVGRAVPLLRAQVAAMEKLDPPAGLGPALRRLYGLDRRSIAELRTAGGAARRRDAGGVAAGLLRFSALRDRVHEAAVSLGIDCEPK
jgi:hypothetical protein